MLGLHEKADALNCVCVCVCVLWRECGGGGGRGTVRAHTRVEGHLDADRRSLHHAKVPQLGDVVRDGHLCRNRRSGCHCVLFVCLFVCLLCDRERGSTKSILCLQDDKRGGERVTGKKGEHGREGGTGRQQILLFLLVIRDNDRRVVHPFAPQKGRERAVAVQPTGPKREGVGWGVTAVWKTAQFVCNESAR